MRVLTYPIGCEQCFSALKGAVEIRLKREREVHFLDVWQKANLDWSICPRCEKLVCLASCWDRASGFCKSCAPYKSATTAAAALAVAAVVAKQTEICPECRKMLTGAIEVVEGEMLGVSVISFEETPDRNWIQCDGCNTLVCKSCCLSPEQGYCNACLKRLRSSESGSREAEVCPLVQIERHTTHTDLGGLVK